VAKSNQSASRPAKSVPDSFDALRDRFMSLRSRLEVLKDILGDPANVSNELGPAAYVLTRRSTMWSSFTAISKAATWPTSTPRRPRRRCNHEQTTIG
jgi:hypothetical protein